MPEISQITLPSGTTYDIKDATARAMASSGVSFTICTSAADTPKDVTWDDSGTTITGTLVASSSTEGTFYLVPITTQSGDDAYAEYVTVENGGSYSWEKIGTTDIDLSNLGALAYKDNATGSYTPTGSVSSSFSGTGVRLVTGNIVVPKTYTSSFSGTAGSVSVTGTPSGSVTVSSAGSTSSAATGLATAAPSATAPANAITYYSVTGETLSLYQIGYNTSSFKTGDASYSFSGSSLTSTGSFTPSGSVTTSTDTTENKTATVSTTTGAATYTPAGSVSSSFSGDAATITVG